MDDKYCSCDSSQNLFCVRLEQFRSFIQFLEDSSENDYFTRLNFYRLKLEIDFIYKYKDAICKALANNCCLDDCIKSFFQRSSEIYDYFILFSQEKDFF